MSVPYAVVTASTAALVRRYQKGGKANYGKIDVALAKEEWKTEEPYVNYMRERTAQQALKKAKKAALALDVKPVDGKTGMVVPAMKAKEVMDADIRDVMKGIEGLKVGDGLLVSKTTTYKLAAGDKKPKA